MKSSRRPAPPRAARALPVVLSLLCACQQVVDGTGPTGEGPGDPGNPGNRPPIAGLQGLAITPASAVVTVDGAATRPSQAYRAVGRFASGERDVTAELNWSLDNTALGGVSGAGLFTASGQAGGVGTVKAASGGVSATATIEVQLRPVVRAEGAPADADKLLPPDVSGEVMAGRSPVIVYPSDRTLFPRNIYKVRFQWDGGTGNDLYRLEFKGDHLTMSVYTTSDFWEPTAAQWAWMATTNAGGKVTWKVVGAAKAQPQMAFRSATADLGFSRESVEGAVYYWSTTVAGVRRATVSDAAPVNFYTPTEAGKCVACHTLSRNGLRLAADVGGEKLGVVDVKNTSQPIINSSQGIESAWATFNPDTTRIVTASNGVLTLRDGATGASLGTVPTGSATLFGTQPDWAPSGKLLAFAQSAKRDDRKISGSSIAVSEYDGAAAVFKAPRVIVASTGAMDSNYYPMFSPDSRWIAFVRAVGGSDNNNTARLLIVAADGSAPPVDLGLANTIVSNQALSGVAAQLADTMPTWAPTGSSQMAFLAFTSLRAYGKVYPYKKVKQIWVTGIDLSALPGRDPSFPAFRLPFQDLMENNHRPFWAEDAFAPPPPDGGMPGGECAPLHADCRSGAPCCAPNICTPDGSGQYTCEAPLG